MPTIQYNSETACYTNLKTDAGHVEVALHKGGTYSLPDSVPFVDALVSRKKMTAVSEEDMSKFKKEKTVIVDFANAATDEAKTERKQEEKVKGIVLEGGPTPVPSNGQLQQEAQAGSEKKTTVVDQAPKEVKK